MGKKLEAVVVDPGSDKADWSKFGEKARELLEVKKVDVIFGCWTSVSRKFTLPVVEAPKSTSDQKHHAEQKTYALI